MGATTAGASAHSLDRDEGAHKLDASVQATELHEKLYARKHISVVDENAADGADHHGQHRKETVEAVMGQLSVQEWGSLIGSAEHFEVENRHPIIKEGEQSHSLYQLTAGTATVELHVEGRPQAVVVARKEKGDIFGERSLLLGGGARASVVVDSPKASVLRLSSAHVHKVLHSAHPQLAGKFYYFLALDQARRLQELSEHVGDSTSVVVEAGSAAPTTIQDLVNNPAYLSILEKCAPLVMLWTTRCPTSQTLVLRPN